MGSFGKGFWRVPNPPGANLLVAERAFSTSDYWGRTGVARCSEEMRQESVGISYYRLLTPVTQDCEDLQGALSATRELAPGGLDTRQGLPRKFVCRFPRNFRKLSAPFPDAIECDFLGANFHEVSAEFL